MYGGFCELLEHLKQCMDRSDFLWFASEEARKYNSAARKLVDSGVPAFNDLCATDKAIAVIIAMALGGGTLQAYIRCASDVPKKDRENYYDNLAVYLQHSFEFPENYAIWLAENI